VCSDRFSGNVRRLMPVRQVYVVSRVHSNRRVTVDLVFAKATPFVFCELRYRNRTSGGGIFQPDSAGSGMVPADVKLVAVSRAVARPRQCFSHLLEVPERCDLTLPAWACHIHGRCVSLILR